MAIFTDYNARREKLMKQMQTLKEFEASDELVGFVFEICRQIFSRKGDVQDIDWLLQRGTELAGYFGILEGRANEKWGEYKVAEIAFTSVRDGLMLAFKDGKTTTVARAEAKRSTEDVEVDVIAREQRSKNYYTAANMCDRMVSFIQTTLKQKEKDMAKADFGKGRNGRR
jgi:hypothetical protein